MRVWTGYLWADASSGSLVRPDVATADTDNAAFIAARTPLSPSCNTTASSSCCATSSALALGMLSDSSEACQRRAALCLIWSSTRTTEPFCVM